jgi:hypothetical protein
MTTFTPTVISPFAQPFGSLDFTHLVITVRHDKAGGFGYGGNKPAGHRLSFSPSIIRDGGRKCILLGEKWDGGFFIRLDDATRSNPHLIKRVAAAVAERRTAFTEAYEARDAECLKGLVHAIADAARITH